MDKSFEGFEPSVEVSSFDEVGVALSEVLVGFLNDALHSCLPEVGVHAFDPAVVP